MIEMSTRVISKEVVVVVVDLLHWVILNGWHIMDQVDDGFHLSLRVGVSRLLFLGLSSFLFSSHFFNSYKNIFFVY